MFSDTGYCICIPFWPVKQLMSVLPSHSKKALPTCVRTTAFILIGSTLLFFLSPPPPPTVPSIYGGRQFPNYWLLPQRLRAGSQREKSGRGKNVYFREYTLLTFQFEWQAVVLLPFIDMDRLRATCDPLEDQLTVVEKRRNRVGRLPFPILRWSLLTSSDWWSPFVYVPCLH